MKIAVVGKGGVGKTTISALLARYAALQGKEVIAIDVDPDMNLSSSLGVEEEITPLIEMEELIAQRTGGKGFVKLNPRVNDIPDKFYREVEGIKLMVFGTVQTGGSGCTCPENAFLKGLLSHLILNREEFVVADMEAGIEHLGRGTGKGVDALLTVIEPDKKSIDTKLRIENLANDLGIENIFSVCNKVRTQEETEFFRNHSKKKPLGSIPFNDQVRKRGRLGKKVPLGQGAIREAIKNIWTNLQDQVTKKTT